MENVQNEIAADSGEKKRGVRSFKTSGVIIYEEKSGEWDKRLAVLTRDYGKLRVFAKGAARPQNKHGGTLRLFAYLDLVVFKGSGFFSLNTCSPRYMYSGITDNYDSICHASYFAQIIDKTVLESDANPGILDLLLYALLAIERGKMPLGLIRSVFEFKLMQYLGFAPVADGCGVCAEVGGGLLFTPPNVSYCGTGKPVPYSGSVNNNKNGGEAAFFFSEQGLVCDGCASHSEKTAPLSKAAIFSLRFIMEKEPKELFSFKLTQQAADELRVAAAIFMNAHCEADIPSVRFLE